MAQLDVLGKEAALLVKKVLKDEGFSLLCKLSLSAGSSKGDNYGGQVHKIQATENNKKLALIVKTQPGDEKLREVQQIYKLFAKEAAFYTEIFPVLKEFQERKRVKSAFDSLPKCYAATEDAIIMEDLKEQNYEMANRLQGLTFPQLKLLITELAKFHALSFAFKDQHPDKFKELKPKCGEVLFGDMMNEDVMNMYTKPLLDSSVEMVEEGFYRSKFNLFIDRYYEYLFQPTHPTGDEEKYCCINHGDCWVNNILFKYFDKEKKKPESLRMLDFQIFRYGSPVLDLSYLIFCSTLKPIRELHWNQMLNLYIETLHQQIKALGSRPNKLYPRLIFEQHINKYMKFGLGMAVMVIPIFTASDDAIPTFDSLDFTKPEGVEEYAKQTEKMRKSDLCKVRMNDIVVEMVERDFI